MPSSSSDRRALTVDTLNPKVLALVDHLGDGIARRAQVLSVSWLPDASDIHRMVAFHVFHSFYKGMGNLL
jgi:hypothetical protein